MEVTLEAVQLFGGNGYMAEFQVEQLCRDAKVLQIYGGTDEIPVSQAAGSLGDAWRDGARRRARLSGAARRRTSRRRDRRVGGARLGVEHLAQPRAPRASSGTVTNSPAGTGAAKAGWMNQIALRREALVGAHGAKGLTSAAGGSSPDQ
jgi:hypothetical protein